MSALLDFLKDPNDQLSSKRLVGLGSWIVSLVYICIFAALGKLGIETGLYALLGMVASGVLGASIDHLPSLFGPKGN